MLGEANLPLTNTTNAINDIDSRLAMELAIEISDLPSILERYHLSKDQLKTKLSNPQFRRMVHENRTTWKSDLSVKERIRVKSMILVEDSLLELYSIFHNQDTAVGARLDAFKSMSKVATVDVPDKDGQSVGERVMININIPGVEKPVTYDGTVIKELADDGKALTYGS